MVNIAQLSAAPLLQDVTGAEEWGDPLNMSQSGVASEPRVVVDANNVVHVIWREDALDSYFYSREDVGVWREPVAVELPFGTPRYAAGLGDVFLYNPKILADDNGRIYAFWLGGKNIAQPFALMFGNSLQEFILFRLIEVNNLQAFLSVFFNQFDIGGRESQVFVNFSDGHGFFLMAKANAAFTGRKVPGEYFE